jgi:hypothetical protein
MRRLLSIKAWMGAKILPPLAETVPIADYLVNGDALSAKLPRVFLDAGDRRIKAWDGFVCPCHLDQRKAMPS